MNYSEGLLDILAGREKLNIFRSKEAEYNPIMIEKIYKVI